MNGLLWKEWRENWLMAVWAALLTLVLLVGVICFTIVDQSGVGRLVDAGTIEPCLMGMWFFAALLCSSAMMAPEIGAGTLQFLSALPISRERIWWMKLTVSVILLALSVALTTVLYIGVYAVASDMGVMHNSLAATLQDLRRYGPEMLFFTLPLCAFGMLVTVLMDRTISALMTAVIVSIAIVVLLVGLIGAPGTPWFNSPAAWWGFAGLCIPLFLNSSYQTFLRGETLRTEARFKIAIPSLVVSAVILVVALTISYYWIVS